MNHSLRTTKPNQGLRIGTLIVPSIDFQDNHSWFCELYRAWVGRLKPTLHPVGERVFVDFAGHTMNVIDAASGEIRRAEVFVAVPGASSYAYAQAT